MPAQPIRYPEAPDRPAPPPPGIHSTPASGAAPLWLQRISLFILVLFCLNLGIVLTLLPWWRDVWDRNLFFQSHPQLWHVLRLGPVRGFISGLGLLDIWVGLSEAIHYRETPRSLPSPPPSAANPETRPHA